jgi:hypothetical protein
MTYGRYKLTDTYEMFCKIIDYPVSPSIHPCPGWGTYYSFGSSVPSGNFKSTPNEK